MACSTLHVSGEALRLDRDGAERLSGALSEAAVEQIEAALPPSARDRAGVRLHGVAELRPLLACSGPVGRLACPRLGDSAQPVRVVVFDKTRTTNWSLGWHQDRTIVVEQRTEVEGFGPWTTKSGLQHVEPPFELIAGMVTLRVHLDRVTEDNAPLLVAPGSHVSGRIPQGRVLGTVRDCGSVPCLAERGGVWIYSTPILHASEAARAPVRRRVLQVDYSGDDLPGGLRWAAV